MEITIDVAIKKAVEFHKVGKLDEAIGMYNAILKVQPTNAIVNHNLGTLAVRGGKVIESLAYFKIALNQDNNIQQHWVSYIEAILSLNKINEAKNILDQSRTFIDDQVFKGLEEKIKKALLTFSQSDSKNDPNTRHPPKERLEVIQDFFLKGNYVEAERVAKQTLNEFPNTAILYNMIGASQAQLKQFDSSIASYKQAISVEPNSVETYLNMASALKEWGKIDAAIESCNKAQKINPNFAPTYYNLANVYKIIGNLKDARYNYDRAITLNPNYANAYLNLGILLYDLGEIKGAIINLNKAITISPNNCKAYNALGNSYRDNGEIELTIKSYKKAISISSTFVDPIDNLGRFLMECNQTSESAKWLQKAVELHLQNSTDATETINYLLRNLFIQDKKDQFIKLFEDSINSGFINPVIGSLSIRAQEKFNVELENSFCLKPMDYIFENSLLDICDFEKIFVNQANKLLGLSTTDRRKQGLLVNGYQTSGNIFDNENVLLVKVKEVILDEIKKYRDHFRDSNEGFLLHWPKDFTLSGWLISMKSGGKIQPHIHDHGWLSGSVYLNVPKKHKENSGNLVICEDYSNNKLEKRIIDVKTGSLCLFPSSLLHYTIPFESDENRTVLAFDIKPK